MGRRPNTAMVMGSQCFAERLGRAFIREDFYAIRLDIDVDEDDPLGLQDLPQLHNDTLIGGKKHSISRAPHDILENPLEIRRRRGVRSRAPPISWKVSSEIERRQQARQTKFVAIAQGACVKARRNEPAARPSLDQTLSAKAGKRLTDRRR